MTPASVADGVASWDDSKHPIVIRYGPGHKAEIHHKIVKDTSERVRAEGLNGAAVSTVMRDAGLTHGGFYKHFSSKDELLIESLKEGFVKSSLSWFVLLRSRPWAKHGRQL